MIAGASLYWGRAAITARLESSGPISRRLAKLRRTFDLAVARDRTRVSEPTVSETLEQVVLRFEVPGYAESELVLTAAPRSVRIRAERLGGAQPLGRVPLDRIIELAEEVDPTRATASLREGVLTVTIAKAAWVRGDARRVPVRVDRSMSPGERYEDESEPRP